MSLRLQMLQIARVAPKALGESADLVRAFLARQFSPAGGALDRAGKPDLYYTIFALAGLQALRAESEIEKRKAKIKKWLKGFGDGADLDFVHLGALARCWSALPSKPKSLAAVCGTLPTRPSRRTSRKLIAALESDRSYLPSPAPDLADAILAHLEKYRSEDGGYDADPSAETGNAYGCFVGLGAYQDLHRELPNPLRMVQCLKFLETPDGAWANARGLKIGSTNATAAAVTLLHQLNMPINPIVGDWLLAQAHPQGGFLAMPKAPVPDLLSTATALHALSCLGREVPVTVRERCLDFIDTLWNAEGGFHGHWADDYLDAEYTFYGLLALGHLSV